MEIFNSQKKFLFDAIDYKPHAGQVAVHNLIDHYPVVTAVAGRRMGKTFLAVYEGVYQAIQPGDAAGPPTVYIVSDTYSHSRKIFLPMAQLFEQHPILKKYLNKVYRKDQIIMLKTGAEIYAKSADTPQSLAGDSVSFAIIDEAGYVNDEAMDILRPAFAARTNPKRLNCGTPDRSDTFFRREFDFGQSESPDYASLVLPSEVNPIVKASGYVEKERKMHSESYFRRMYLAEFSEVDGAPFSRILDDVEVGVPQEPAPGRRYIAGVDLADRRDWTVVVIIDITEQPARTVHVSRWNGIGYEATGKRISDILRKYNNAYAFVDKTGVGDAAINFITAHYGNVEPVNMMMGMKQTAFDKLYSALEKKDLVLLDDKTMLSELRNLRAIPRPSGGISYTAPQGLTDDVAMALFLASRGLTFTPQVPENFFASYGMAM